MEGFLNVVMWKSAAALAVTAIALLLPGQALAQSGEVIEYIHTNALGSRVAVTNAAGQVIETTVYEPYGGVVNRPLSDAPGYTGHVTDASTGLSYMQQRYYDPEVGVFLSVDPVTAHQQPVGQFHRYRYANGHPYKFTDPDGRIVVDKLRDSSILGRSSGGRCLLDTRCRFALQQSGDGGKSESKSAESKGWYWKGSEFNHAAEIVGAMGLGLRFKRDMKERKNSAGIVIIGVGAKANAAAVVQPAPSVDVIKAGYRWGGE